MIGTYTLEGMRRKFRPLPKVNNSSSSKAIVLAFLDYAGSRRGIDLKGMTMEQQVRAIQAYLEERRRQEREQERKQREQERRRELERQREFRIA